MLKEIFYSDIENQIPKQVFYGKLIRSPVGSGKIESISLLNPREGVEIFPFSEIFPDFDGTIHYEGEPVALAVSADSAALKEIVEQDGIVKTIPCDEQNSFTPRSDFLTNITSENEAEFNGLFDSLPFVTEKTWESSFTNFSCRETEGAAAYFDGEKITMFPRCQKKSRRCSRRAKKTFRS